MKNSKNGVPTAIAQELSPSRRAKIIEYVRAQLADRFRSVLDCRDEGMTFERIGRKLHRDLTTIQHDDTSAMEQLQLALEAPWMNEFRAEVLAGKQPPLPEAILTLNFAEVAAMRMVSPKDTHAILTSTYTLASRIAQEVDVSARAVRGVLKCAGKWPLLRNEDIIAVFERENGNITRTAKALGEDRTRISHRLHMQGIASREKRGKRWSRRVQ